MAASPKAVAGSLVARGGLVIRVAVRLVSRTLCGHPWGTSDRTACPAIVPVRSGRAEMAPDAVAEIVLIDWTATIESLSFGQNKTNNFIRNH